MATALIHRDKYLFDMGFHETLIFIEDNLKTFILLCLFITCTVTMRFSFATVSLVQKIWFINGVDNVN